MKKVLKLSAVKKLVKILEDKASLNMHNEVGSGYLFKKSYEDFLSTFDVDKFIKENTIDSITFESVKMKSELEKEAYEKGFINVEEMLTFTYKQKKVK